MGVGGKFWDLLKPYARHEGPDFLTNKRVAVDLSYWIVQHETAIKSSVRKPHLRLTFFRTINLFSKFGAFPVFVVDGTPSPLKSRARILRFFRSSGIEISDLPVPEDGVSVERNGAFLKCVKECVELLELLGMPVLKANGEAEALCAQLNLEGLVDACITSDSDAFLFGAKCVIKSIKPDSKEPFECYQMSDIETGLGLKRNHLVAIALLVGNDHDLNGVRGIGVDTALRFVQTFPDDEILNGLREIGKGNADMVQDISKVKETDMIDPYENSPKSKSSHCTLCGHPGSKRAHFKSSCEYCDTTSAEGCTRKPEGFKCNCISCNKIRKDKEQQKLENWHNKVHDKISMELNFPNDDIIEMYLCTSHVNFIEDGGTFLSWGSPNSEMLVDFLAFHQLWEPSYIRQRMLPMLSTIYLREMIEKTEKTLLYGQYEFNSIQRVKIRNGHKFYVIKWKKAVHTVSIDIDTDTPEDSDMQQEDIVEIDDSIDQLEEYNVPHSYVHGGCWFLLTDENMDLVRGAFPDAVDRYLKEKELKESKSKKSSGSKGKSESVKSPGIQKNITEFFQSTKVQFHATGGEEQADCSKNQDGVISKEKRKISSSNLPKSVRRRLLFK
ncbi:flap endonuclease GEN-like 1 [Mercurialis annua]|uniref:flap endonuclease GEN-like 1 n=1 Tax=Mercurialis annua TaxID=3986 RepID=UPI002160FE77|nr:flap endonuclease GEN-like 1 [Mercurialis annua]